MALSTGDKPAERGQGRLELHELPSHCNGIKFHYICSAMQHPGGPPVTWSGREKVTGAGRQGQKLPRRPTITARPPSGATSRSTEAA